MKARRERTAWLGIFAILFQAVLLGWHHHDLEFANRAGSPALSAPASGGSHSAADDADGCEICIVLHHQAAAPLAFMPTPAPGLAAAPRLGRNRVFFVLADYRGFHSRAPP